MKPIFKSPIIIVLIILLCLFNILNAQTPSWLWADASGGASDDEGRSVCTDAAGNVFITGIFHSPTITFGNITLTNTDNSGNSGDLFVVKYSPLGKVLWAKLGGGVYNDYGLGICTDTSGNVIVTGTFDSPILTLGSTTLTNVAGISNDFFVVKYTSSGNLIWAKAEGGTNLDTGNGVSSDVSGNVWVVGSFRSSILTIGTFTLNNIGGNDIFVVKYSPAGNVLFAKAAGGSSKEYGFAISTDNNGNGYVTGSFESSTINYGTSTLSNAGNSDIFLAKYDAAGNEIWAKAIGGTSIDEGYSISTDKFGNTYITGCFFSPSITSGTTTLTRVGLSDIIILKYNASGNLLWAKSSGGIRGDIGFGISTDLSGNITVGGEFQSPSITFDTYTLTNTTSQPNVFVVKYSSAGNVLWAKSAGGSGDNNAYAICNDANGNTFLTGYYRSAAIAFGTATLNTVGMIDLFITKLGQANTNTTSSIEYRVNNLEYSIYPNPIKDRFNILTNETNQIFKFEIYCLNGEKKCEINCLQNENLQNIELSDIPDGLYILRAITNNGINNKKVIIKH